MATAKKISRLRKLRKAAGLTVRELADQVGVQHSNIVFWENNDKLPRSEVLLPMARALGVSVEELLGAPKPKRNGAPGGRVGHTFQQVAKLPRRKQAKILDVVDALLAQQGAGDSSS